MIIVKKYEGSWCTHCKALDSNLKGRDYTSVDVEQNIEESARLNIRNLPTTIFFKDGEIVERITGLFSAEKFDEIIEKYK